jgi:hypothetical protein
MPIGVFHGTADPFTPVKGVKDLKRQVRNAGKSHMKFHHFENQGHDRGIGMYLYKCMCATFGAHATITTVAHNKLTSIAIISL